MATKEDLLEIKRRLKKDKRMQRLEDAFNRLPEYNLDVGELYEEVQRIHMTRKTRQLERTSKSFVQDLIDGMLNDQAYRSRLTEILMSCVHVTRNLNDTLTSLEGYLLMEYANQVGAIRTKGERESFMRLHVLSKFHKYSDRVTRIKEAAEIVIVDIDKAGFVYRNLLEAAKLSAGQREVLG